MSNHLKDPKHPYREQTTWETEVVLLVHILVLEINAKGEEDVSACEVVSVGWLVLNMMG